MVGWPQVFVWDVASGRVIRKFAGHDGVTNTVRARTGIALVHRLLCAFCPLPHAASLTSPPSSNL